MKKIIFIYGILGLISSINAQNEVTLESVLDGTFRSKSIGSYQWVNDEDAYYFSEKDSLGTNILKYNVATGDTSDAFSISKNLIENFSYSFNADQTKLLLKTNNRKLWRHSSYGTYHIYDITSQNLISVSANPDSLRNVKFSPNSEYISYVRNDNNLYVYSLKNDEESQLTFDGSDTILNGHHGWVYEEEFGSYDSYKWSPTSSFIAFAQEDQSLVKKYPLVDFETKYPTVKYIYYPKSGEDNPIISLKLIDIDSREISSIATPEDGYYYPRIFWQKETDNLFYTTLNRKQNDWKLYSYEILNDSFRLILNDKNDTWIDAFDFFGMSGVFNIDILSNGDIIWTSERDGYKHIYRSRPDGRFINQITRGDWEVNGIYGIDEENEIIYFNAKKESEIENHIYSIRFNGTRLKRLSKEDGSHYGSFSPTLNYFIDYYSNLELPTQIKVKSNSGTLKRTLVENSRSIYDEYGFTYPNVIDIFTDDGIRLNGLITLPHNFDPSKQYPVILHNYGGPGSQIVQNSWGAGRHTFHQYFAENGFII